MNPLRRDGDDLLLCCKVQPRSKDNAFGEVRNGEIVVKLKAPPVDGKANDGLIRFVSTAFGVAPGRVSIERGERARHKVVRIKAAHTVPAKLSIFGLNAGL